jgi:hypothetical protein
MSLAKRGGVILSSFKGLGKKSVVVSVTAGEPRRDKEIYRAALKRK